MPRSVQAARERARRITANLEDEARSRWPELSNLFSARTLIAATRDEQARYGKFPTAILATLDQAGKLPGGTRELLGRLLFTSLMAEAIPRFSTLRLPRSVLALYPPQLERILDAVESGASPVDLREDRWKKDYALLTGSLIPLGAEFADPASGIPRRLLIRGSPAQRMQLFFTTLHTRGFHPFFELHAHPDSLADFTPEGWLKTYHRTAELLLLNPPYKGVIASSWFRDPQLAAISPKLRYLRDYPERHGARMFLVGPDTDASSGALARSPTRKRLYCEGKYIPMIHMMVWPRSALLRWHTDTRAKDAFS